MTKATTREQFQELAKFIAGLIRARAPAMSPDNVKKEALPLARVIHNTFLYVHHRPEIKEKTEKQAKEELRQISRTASKLSKLITGLSFSSTFEISITHGDLSSQDDWNRVLRAVGDLEEGAKRALAGSKPQRGRNIDNERQRFVETVLQVFELSSGDKIAAIEKLAPPQRRQRMTPLFRLLDKSIFHLRYFQDFDAATKYTQRYIKKVRPEHMDVTATIQATLTKDRMGN